MSGLPEGWAKVRVGDLIQLNPKVTAADQTDAGFSPMPMLTTSYRGEVGFEVRPWGAIKKAYTHFADGDVLLAKITPCFENGKAGLAHGLPNAIGAGSSEYFVCRAKPDLLEPRYLLAFFKSEEFRREAVPQMSGSVGHKRVPKDFLLDSRLALAPLPEQKRIADKLDNLLARVDTCRNHLARVPAFLKHFRQSVLAAATSGELTAEWRAVSPPFSAEADLASIMRIRRTLSKKQKPPVAQLSADQYPIPEQWVWTSLDTLAAQIVDGTHHTPKYVSGGIPFISVKDVRNGKIDLSDTKFISEEEHGELCKRCDPRPGDLLITKSGTIGRTAIVPNDAEFSLFVSVALIKPATPIVNMKFIDIVLKEWVGRIDVSTRIVGTAIKNLHLQDMRVLAIPFPTLAEQAEIVRRVESLFALADQLEARYSTARTHIDRLTPALLAKAFRGQLVPQVPGDTRANPARSEGRVEPLSRKAKSEPDRR